MALVAAAVSAEATEQGGAEKRPRPSIVLLVADDLGYGELECQGNAQIPTPNIDSIARHGVRFSAGYVAAPYCSPSRAGLLTGRYPSRFGYEFNPIGAHNQDPGVGLPAAEITLASHLREAGYTTALIGKWHLGGHPRQQPLRRGFDEFFGFTHEGHFFVPPPYRGVVTMLRRRRLPNGGEGRWISAGGTLVYSTHMGHQEPAYDADNPIVRGGQPVEETRYLTEALTREAVDFIGRHSDKPFFLCLAYNAVHSPLQAPITYMRRFEASGERPIDDVHRRIFAAMLASLDDSVGAVLEKLREEGLEEDTLVFFISDNGGPTRELTSSNLPLRGGKGDVYEGGIRVPFLVQWKGHLPAGRLYPSPVISLDIYATAAAAARVPLPARRQIDGVNLLPYLRGANAAAPHEVLYWRFKRRTAVRVGDWKLVRQARRAAARWELYHLTEDISEANDLAAQRPGKLRELESIWTELEAQMVAPSWAPP